MNSRVHFSEVIMNTSLVEDMNTIIDLLYQNQKDTGYTWVIQNLQLIHQQMQESAIFWSNHKKVDLEEEYRVALAYVKELMEILQQNNILKLADYLKLVICEYLKVGVVL